MNVQSKILSTAAIFAAASLTAITASAGDVTKVTAKTPAVDQQITVDYSDLDLTSPKAQEVLHSRISQAAKKVCGPQFARQAGGVSLAARNRACYDEAFSGAISQVNAAVVAQSN
ncbi:MAG: UrcA family protein [Pseudomonadota bacterium]